MPEEAQDSGPLPFVVAKWSSQRDAARNAAVNLSPAEAAARPGCAWESNGPPEQWLILDMGEEVLVSSLRLNCPGAPTDPKVVSVFRGTSNASLEDSRRGEYGPRSMQHRASAGGLLPAPEGPWVMVRRGELAAGPEQAPKGQLHAISFEPNWARFWRVVFHSAWGSERNVRVAAPLELVQPARSPPRAKRDVSPTTMFSEDVNLSREDRELRMIARRNAIPLDFAEVIQEQFRRFDSAGCGTLGYLDFANVVRTMTQRKAKAGSLAIEVPESRIRALWHDVDTDGSGGIELEEFLVWFFRTFNGGDEPLPSHHSDQLADSVPERFYASLGQQRLRGFLAAMKEEEEARQHATAAAWGGDDEDSQPYASEDGASWEPAAPGQEN